MTDVPTDPPHRGRGALPGHAQFKQSLAVTSERDRRFCAVFIEVAMLHARDYGISEIVWHRAFPTSPLKAKAAKQAANDLLKRPEIKSLISEMRREYSLRQPIPASRVVEELSRIAISNVEDYIRTDKHGNTTVDLRGVSREQMAAVSEITTIETKDAQGRKVTKTKLKMLSKIAAGEQLLKVFGAYAQPDEEYTAAEVMRLIVSMKRRMGLPLVDESESTITDVTPESDGEE